MANLFQDRTEAGQALAMRLRYFAERPDVLVLALSREGVPVASEVARELRAPLDVLLSRKLGVPGREELAMGAVASGSVLVTNNRVVNMLNISGDTISKAAIREGSELERREQIYRAGRADLNARERIVVLVDDGLASGMAVRAAAVALRRQDPAGVIVALPIAAPETCAELESAVEQVICLETPTPMYAIGLHYRHFPRVTDEEVLGLLQQSVEDLAPAVGGNRKGPRPDGK